MDSASPSGLTLLEALRREIRTRHLSIRTEQQYVYWVRWFVRHFQRRHPREMGAAEVQDFLAMLVNERRVSASTHNQALSALLFLYRAVLGQDLPWMNRIERPKRPQRLPAILTVEEVQAVLARMEGEHALLARLLYGTGMRIMEALRLRVKDVDFARRTLIVREGKGNKDRALMLPDSLADDLRAHLACSRALWLRDRAERRPGVEMPDALARKYPHAAESWAWHWVFPQATLSRDPRSGVQRRHPLFDRPSSTRPSSAHSGVPPSPRNCTSRPRRTACAMRLRPTCCRPATTSAPCRSCWDMRMSARP